MVRIRSMEELLKLPIAVILDEELGVLINDTKSELDMDLIKLVVEGRGLKEVYPELYV